jgi:hypothetical protein
LSIPPDHKYIWFRGGDLNHYKVHFRKGVDRNLIFGMGGDADVKLYIQHFSSPGLSPIPLGNLFKKM